MRTAESRVDSYVIGQTGTRTEDPTEIEKTVTGLFDEHRPGLLRYLSSIGLPMADAEEVVQEAFLALFDHLECGRPRQNLPGWLYRVAHNQGLRRRERNGRQISVPGPTERREPRTPEDELRAREHQSRLVVALEGLAESDRQCILLRAEGFRYRQIARITGLSLGGVALALKRALHALAEEGSRT